MDQEEGDESGTYLEHVGYFKNLSPQNISHVAEFILPIQMVSPIFRLTHGRTC